MEEAGNQLRAVVPPHFLPSSAHEPSTTTVLPAALLQPGSASTTSTLHPLQLLQQTSTALYPTSDSATMAALAEVEKAVNCVEIKEYLWQNSSDLTSLPSTMGVFAVIYTLIITWVLAQGLSGAKGSGGIGPLLLIAGAGIDFSMACGTWVGCLVPRRRRLSAARVINDPAGHVVAPPGVGRAGRARHRTAGSVC